MAYPRLDSHGLSTMLTRLASVIRQGHTIKSDDATMTQRKNLKIIGATVTDNALADQTELTIPNGGHTIISSSMLPIGGSTLPMAGRDNLQFGSEYDPIFTEDDPTNNKTIVHGQLFVCDSESDWKTLSDAAFKAKYGADREQVGVYWLRPWANSIAYQTDLTPIGTVLSLVVDITRLSANLIEFPNNDYLICRGATVKISDYPKLYQYFADKYGDGNYFGNSQTAEGYFVLPNWSADFPTNGVLVIKARITSDVITFAEVDQTGESARTDEVPSCARVAAIEAKTSHTPTAESGVSAQFTIKKCGGVKCVAGYIFISSAKSTGTLLAKITDSDFCPQSISFISANGTNGVAKALTVYTNGDIKTGDFTFEASTTWILTGTWI